MPVGPTGVLLLLGSVAQRRGRWWRVRSSLTGCDASVSCWEPPKHRIRNLSRVSHLLIDVNEAIDPNEAIPQDKNHLHLGTGPTEARIELSPGKHMLQLVLGDAKHFPFKPPVVSKEITVFIK
jgi:Domain of unknown function (DUF4399)